MGCQYGTLLNGSKGGATYRQSARDKPRDAVNGFSGWAVSIYWSDTEKRTWFIEFINSSAVLQQEQLNVAL